MNKILIDNKVSSNEFIIKEDTFITCFDVSSNLLLNIERTSKVFIYIKNSNLNIDIKLYSNLDIDLFVVNSSISISTYLEEENIKMNYNYRNINKNNNSYLLNIYHNKKNTSSDVTNNGINLYNNRLDYAINGIIKKDSINTHCSQDSKIIIMEDNNSSIKPNLIVDNSEIDASHSSYIGRFSLEKIFYLKSRGLEEKDCLKLLVSSFLLEKLNIVDDEKELILGEINTVWR